MWIASARFKSLTPDLVNTHLTCVPLAYELNVQNAKQSLIFFVLILDQYSNYCENNHRSFLDKSEKA